MQLRIIYTIFAISAIAIWEYSAKNNTVRLLISSPRLIIAYLLDNYSSLGEATLTTFYEAILGLILATTFSFSIMILFFYFPSLMRVILPILVASQVIPLITLAPLFIILFGTGITAKIMMAALLCFFPIVVNFSNGVRLISENIKDMLYIYNANTAQYIWYVYFPLSLPNIISGLKIAATLAVIGAVVAEFNGAELGLGKNLFLAAKKLEPELMVCSLLLSTLLGGLIYFLIVVVEQIKGKWYLK